MPHVDLNTNKIYGCKPGTWPYYHEQGHLLYDRQAWSSQLTLIQQYAFNFWMMSCTLAVINKYMLVLALPLLLIYLGIDIYEEVWCNRYANKKIKLA